jgi:ribonuclease-3
MKLLAASLGLPEYKVVKTEGKEHSKVFFVDVMSNGAAVGSGSGKTIKEAEQMAAKKAIEKLAKEA